MNTKDRPGSAAGSNEIRKDAAGQFAKPERHSDNNGVASAKPRVVTGSDDATANKRPPGEKKTDKDWDVNYEPRQAKDGEFRG
ncbi:hypothetical protein [Rhizobium sp. Root482]|uniref:hypothetical protein n=1 Tax=Rhizobium sp. Root482 TaxID=1736543 RepID=UPI0006F1D159|nr:hypothetical protein [Rhizobium sp. Root482]KQY11444.1 hypothetical protein ASD31_18930 [Rhizobium sp. Root482]